jgi:hypothetical protein
VPDVSGDPDEHLLCGRNIKICVVEQWLIHVVFVGMRNHCERSVGVILLIRYPVHAGVEFLTFSKAICLILLQPAAQFAYIGYNTCTFIVKSKM